MKEWSKGMPFKLHGKKFYVADLDTESHYQTGFIRTYLKYFTQVRGKYVALWIDSMEVE